MPKPGANHGFAGSKSRGRPGKRHARVDVERVGVAETGAHAAEACCTAGREVERVGLSVSFVKNVVEAVADAEIQSEVGPQLPLVLRIGVHLRLAQAIHWQLVINVAEDDGVHKKTGMRRFSEE